MTLVTEIEKRKIVVPTHYKKHFSKKTRNNKRQSRMLRLRITILVTISAFLLPQVSHAYRVLFIGNSFTGRSITYLEEFNKSNPNEEDSFTYRLLGGTNLEERFQDQSVQTALQCERYDYVVLQDHSRQTLLNYPGFVNAVEQFSALVRKQGAEPILFETWVRAERINSYLNNQNTAIDAYHEIGDDLGIHVVHVGHIFRDMFFANRSLFFQLYHPDKIHQSVYGNFVIATSIFDSLHPGNRRWSPSIGLPGSVRSAIQNFSQNVNTPIAPHTNPFTRPVCDLERSRSIRAKCGCPDIPASAINGMIELLLD